MTSKHSLRSTLRKARQDHVATIPAAISALLFKQPPGPLRALIPGGAIIGLYHATEAEAPAASYARYFLEAGHQVALPRITGGTGGGMEFRAHTDPFEECDLEAGPFGLMQPGEDADVMTPDIVFVPLLGFTDSGARLGQGGGFYDRWLASHPKAVAIGLAWDMQLVENLPVEPHDIPLTAIVTPTRIYGPFDAR